MVAGLEVWLTSAVQNMASFDPILALLGGALIGLASVLLMMLTGRIAGISGILGGCLTLAAGDKVWRLAGFFAKRSP